jgi:hypothetical protein
MRVLAKSIVAASFCGGPLVGIPEKEYPKIPSFQGWILASTPFSNPDQDTPLSFLYAENMPKKNFLLTKCYRFFFALAP